MYSTWGYYSSKFYGKCLDDIEYKRLARQASAFLDRSTFGQIDDFWTTDDRVIDAECALIDILYSYSNSLEQRGISSMSVGSESVSYTSDADSAYALQSEMYEACKLYLWGTCLLNRGKR